MINLHELAKEKLGDRFEIEVSAGNLATTLRISWPLGHIGIVYSNILLGDVSKQTSDFICGDIEAALKAKGWL